MSPINLTVRKKDTLFLCPVFYKLTHHFLKPISRQIIKGFNACLSSRLVRLRRAQKCFGGLRQSRVCCYQRILMMSNMLWNSFPHFKTNLCYMLKCSFIPQSQYGAVIWFTFLEVAPFKENDYRYLKPGIFQHFGIRLWEMSLNSIIILHINQFIVQKSKGKEALKFRLAFI